MKKNIGFTHLGKKLTPLGKRENKKKSILSILIINENSGSFSLPALRQSWQIIKSVDHLGEIIIIDNDPSQSKTEAILSEFSEIRILIPTEKLSFSESFYLGINEAVSPHVLIIDSSCYIKHIDLDNVFKNFNNNRTFALGFQLIDTEGNPIPSVVKAFLDRGRLSMIEGNRNFAASSLLLKNYFGIYDREKVLFLTQPYSSSSTVWPMIDFFFNAWSRGWMTTIDPVNRLEIPFLPASVFPQNKFRIKLRYHRLELRFLRKYFTDKKSKIYTKKHFFKISLKKMLKFDFSMILAFIFENSSTLFIRTKIRERSKSFFTPLDVLNFLMETGKNENSGYSAGPAGIKKTPG